MHFTCICPEEIWETTNTSATPVKNDIKRQRKRVLERVDGCYSVLVR
jgi:hypothetical protein